MKVNNNRSSFMRAVRKFQKKKEVPIGTAWKEPKVMRTCTEDESVLYITESIIRHSDDFTGRAQKLEIFLKFRILCLIS